MEPLSVVLNKIKLGFAGEMDTSCYHRIGRTLLVHGDELLAMDAVVALYAPAVTKLYVHAAIETIDGVLIDEKERHANLRDADGRITRLDRIVLHVSSVMAWLRAYAIQ